MMWDFAMQKHEVYKVAIMKALINLAQKVKCNELKIMFQKIKQQPLNQTDKFLMLLLKTIAKNIAQVIHTDRPG